MAAGASGGSTGTAARFTVPRAAPVAGRKSGMASLKMKMKMNETATMMKMPPSGDEAHREAVDELDPLDAARLGLDPLADAGRSGGGGGGGGHGRYRPLPRVGFE